MSNNKNYGKKAGIAGGIGVFLLAAVVSFLVNGFGEKKAPENNMQAPETYAAQMWQDLDAMQPDEAQTVVYSLSSLGNY